MNYIRFEQNARGHVIVAAEYAERGELRDDPTEVLIQRPRTPEERIMCRQHAIAQMAVKDAQRFGRLRRVKSRPEQSYSPADILQQAFKAWGQSF